MQTSNTADIRSGPQQLYQRPYIVADGANPPTLAGVVDLQNTVDTSTHVRYADGKSTRIQPDAYEFLLTI